jgi:hypothetical protein
VVNVRDSFLCLDCGMDTHTGNEYYMVHNEVWTAAGMKNPGTDGDGMLCIGCIESRIGRQLNAADFPDYPINTGFFGQSERLMSRLLDTTG